MAVKHKYLYLFLTLACFLGIILIFIFDGYMGVYDSLVMDNGQVRQTVEADQWLQQEKFGYLASVGVERGGRVDFTYRVENHRFSEYSATVEVSLWFGQDKLDDIIKQSLAAGSFDKRELKWTLDTKEFIPAGYPPEQGYNMNVVIRRGEIERKVTVYVNPSPFPPKPLIAPTR